MMKIAVMISRVVMARVPIKLIFTSIFLLLNSFLFLCQSFALWLERDFILVFAFCITLYWQWVQSDKKKYAFYGFASSSTLRWCCLHAEHIQGWHGWLTKVEWPKMAGCFIRFGGFCVASGAPSCINCLWKVEQDKVSSFKQILIKIFVEIRFYWFSTQFLQCESLIGKSHIPRSLNFQSLSTKRWCNQ